MLNQSLLKPTFALFFSVALLSACGGSQQPAESPEAAPAAAPETTPSEGDAPAGETSGEAPAGEHTMPDGTTMPGHEHGAPEGESKP